MYKNFTLVKDNLLTNEQCDEIIKYYHQSTNKKENYYNICHDTPIWQSKQIQELLDEYMETYPEIRKTPSCLSLQETRIKYFKPNNYFNEWHFEHNYSSSYRVLCLMIYLSNHNCGTEFWNGDIVKSVKGRAVLFPAYFTHTHRGQKCPENKDRYLYGGYFNYIK